MIRTFFVVLYVILYLILGIPVLGIFWLISRNEKWKDAAALAQLRLVQWAFRCICVISGVKLTVIGEDQVPTDEPVLYIGNHRSYFDIVISYARCPRLTGYIAKDSMLKIPLLSTWMKRLNCLFINREDIKESLKTILAGIENVKNGISMCIYPEGTRGKGTDELDMLPFKEGSLKIAEKTGCKIVPMAMTGSADIFEKHVPFIRKARVILEYGAPIDVAALSKEDKKKLGSYCQAEITRMLEKHRSM
ncbi:MAG: lysophospholipid acyltransferase family protein [bacterium]|nr:lysophospholipid acyltransferase family protein [bacterium]MDY4100230.1 lysophospholipid acyltransferase family protein [Lachnospiraceae bacterium]